MIPTVLRVVLYLAVADGIVALYLAEFIGPLGAGLLAASLAASLAYQRIRPRVNARPAFGRALVGAAAAASALDLAYLAGAVLDALVRLLLFLAVYKLFTLQTVRDSRTVGFLAFFMLVAASSSAFGVSYLFVVVAFLGLAPWLLLLQQFLGAAEAGASAGGPPPRVPTRALVVLVLGAWLGALAITGGLFFLIPRVGLAALPLRARLAPLVTGFSDRVELGAYGEIETDATVVMRVHVPEWVRNPERLPNLRWRGIALDEFDGRAWTAREPERRPLSRSGNGDFPVSAPRGTGRILVQEIYLEPLGTRVLFAAPRVLRLWLRGPPVELDQMGGVSLGAPAMRVSYTVESELEGAQPRDAPLRSAPVGTDDHRLPRYVQLPPLPARVHALAREVTAGSRDAYEAARRLTDFLSRSYRYTLRLAHDPALDPIEEFLFVRRAGNCEYFAASLAVMLRSLGIPARVVNGFQRGEWNPYGRYFMVRLRDAHSWVEAGVGGAGWTTFDPSPRAALDAGAAYGPVALYLDALRMRWYRYVVNWSLRDQVSAASAIRREALAWRPSRMTAADWEALARPAVVALFVLVVGLAAWSRRRGPGGQAPKAGGRTLRLYERAWRAVARRGLRPAASRSYDRALRAVARRGLRPALHETAREFSRRVGETAPPWADPFAHVTGAYERWRFGGADLAPGDAGRLEACLAALERRGRSPRGSPATGEAQSPSGGVAAATRGGSGVFRDPPAD